VIGSFGAELLDWLNRYTFPAGIRYVRRKPRLIERFLDALLLRHDGGGGVSLRPQVSARPCSGGAVTMRLITGRDAESDLMRPATRRRGQANGLR
jgi:hypothetical protein